jgi:hypothetical protein
MPSGTGITADTPVSLVMGAGVLLKNHAFVGPTIGANLFAVEREYHTPALNGIMGDLKGTDNIVRSVGRIEANVPQMNADMIASGLPGVTVTPGGGMTVITESASRRVPDTAYADYELDLDRPDGGQYQFEVNDAINTGSFESDLDNAGTYAPRHIYTGRMDAADLTASPWTIRILDVAS